MSDDIERRLRTHLADAASTVEATPDPEGLLLRTSGRSSRRGVVAAGGAVLACVVAGAGILVGATVVASSPTTSDRSPTPATAGRAGAALAPAAGTSLPSDSGQTPYAFLFSRVSLTGVTIRAYSSAGTGLGACAAGSACSPPVTVPVATPCATGAICARPLVEPPVTSVPGQSAGSTEDTGSTGNTGDSGAAGSNGSPSSSGSTTDTGCSDVIVELSTDRAVGTGSVVRPSSSPSSSDTVAVLGSGSFGSAEGGPAGWVAVWVGSTVASVELTGGGSVVDTMAPVGGLALLADTGPQGIAGDTVVGLSQAGAPVGSAPADQSNVPDLGSGCPVTTPVTTPSTTPSTTTTGPSTTTTTPPHSATTTTEPPDTTTLRPAQVTPGVVLRAALRPRG